MTTTTAPPSTATDRRRDARPSITVRPLRPGEAVEIRRLFRTSLPLGRRLELQYADIVSYERQCLDWYLAHARDLGRVAEVEGRIVAFLLPCFDARARDGWTRRRALRWATQAVYRFGVGRLGAQGRRFMELRLRDVPEARRRRAADALRCSALVHVTSARGPAARAVESLLAAMDEIVRLEGSPAWSYDVQFRGTAAPGPGVLDELHDSGHSVDRIVLDRTLSWLAAEPVLRVTVTRRVTRAAG